VPDVARGIPVIARADVARAAPAAAEYALYAPGLALVPPLRDRPWRHAEGLAALARVSTAAELGAIGAAPAALRAAYLLLAETARALHTLLLAPRGAAWPGSGAAAPDLDLAVRRELAARVGRMAEWYRARLPAEDHVAPAYELCREVEAALA
jgi:hypothetical protein